MTAEEKKKLVESKIAKFEEFFTSLGNEPLVKPERAILATYLVWDLGLVEEQKTDAQADGVSPTVRAV